MPAFGSIAAPVRSSVPIEVNSPGGFMTEPPGDLWWTGMRDWWEASIPSSVTKAESVLINPLVRMPWTVRGKDGGEQEYSWLTDPMLLNGVMPGGPKTDAFERFPQLDRIDRFDFWSAWIRDAMRHGVGVITYVPAADDRMPLAGSLSLASPWNLYKGNDGWAMADDRGGLHTLDKQGTMDLPNERRRVLLLRHSIPGGIFGRHRAEMHLAHRTRSYGTEVLDTATPSGIITTDQPINQNQSDTIRTRWDERQRRRSVAVLGNGAKYQQVTMSPVDAELVALANLSDKQVAHMYELSAWELDAPSGDSMTYANIGEKRQDRVDGPLASWSARVEETLSALLPWGTRLTIDFSSYTLSTKEATDGPIGTA